MRPPTWEQLELAQRLRERRDACCSSLSADTYKPPEQHFLGAAPWFWPAAAGFIGVALLLDYARGKGLWSKRK